MVVFDTSTIVLALDPSAKPPADESGQVVTNCKERVAHLLDPLNTSKTLSNNLIERCTGADATVKDCSIMKPYIS